MQDLTPVSSRIGAIDVMSLAILTGLVLVVAQTESSSAPLAVQYAAQGRVERLQKLLEADPKAVVVTDPNEAALQASGVLPSAAQTRRPESWSITPMM